jgi:hypothetical protein
MRFSIAAAICALAFCSPAIAGEATCADYSRAKGEDRSLFNGFIYGFVMAKIAERGDAEVNTATARVKEMADKYCPTHSGDRLTQVFSTFVKVVIQYRSEANPPPGPWETHKQCEEMALKLTYPRKLNGCADDTCKSLTENWLNEAAQAKRDCLQKKLG